MIERKKNPTLKDIIEAAGGEIPVRMRMRRGGIITQYMDYDDFVKYLAVSNQGCVASYDHISLFPSRYTSEEKH